jgi:3-deoxy-manno-octulosonate cytidylyltransferase (CMP-KDO synthetase)
MQPATGSSIKALGVIPARYASTRFPGKPLALLAGKPLVQWVYERATKARRLDEVIVATDDQRIFDCVKQFGGAVRMTRPDHPSGSDRVAEAARHSDAGLIVNIQGDEPLMAPEAIDLGVELLASHPDDRVGTLVRPLARPEELGDPNVAKVVLADDGHALYFSRSPIPHVRGGGGDPSRWPQLYSNYYKHIGLYVFRRDFLFQFVSWPPGTLERAESLEQLRILERGVKIAVAITDYEARGIDTPDDLQRLINDLEDGRIGDFG